MSTADAPSDSVRRSQDSFKPKSRKVSMASEKDSNFRKSQLSNHKRVNESIQEFDVEDEDLLRVDEKPQVFTKNYFSLANTFPADLHIEHCQQTEANGIAAAEIVLDEILTRGSKHIYEQYVAPKVLPYAAGKVTRIFHALANYVNIGKDQETQDKALYSELWEDDGEPAPPKPPLWMGDQIKVVRPAPPAVQPDRIKIINPKRKKSLKKMQSTRNSIVEARKDGVLNIQAVSTSPSPLDMIQDNNVEKSNQFRRMMTRTMGEGRFKKMFNASSNDANISVGKYSSTKNLIATLSSKSKKSKSPKVSPRSKRTPRSQVKEVKKEAKPQKLELPPRPPPMQHEPDLRKYIQRKEHRKEEEMRMEQEQAIVMAAQLKELQKKQGQNVTRKGAEVEQYYQKLKNGELSFDSSGKPMLVKRPNPKRLPKMLSSPNADVDGVNVHKVEEEEPDLEEDSRITREQKVRYSTMSDFNSQPEKQQSAVRVRPVTANLNQKKVVVKQKVSEVIAKNAEISAKMAKIEKEMSAQLQMNQTTLVEAGKPIESGGLYNGIDDVASNVTYTTGDYRKVGKRSAMEGRLSLQEYEALSMAQERRSEIGFKMDNFDSGGQEMMAILEKDGNMEEQSIESVHLSSKTAGHKKTLSYRTGSPGRVVKAQGTDQVIKQMFETQPVTLVAQESHGFLALKQAVNSRYSGKPSRLWSAAIRTEPGAGGEMLSGRAGSKQHNHQAASNQKFQMTMTSPGNFFVGSSQIRNSYDKVISYDTSSLIDGLGDKENNKNGRNKDRMMLTTGVPKLKQRPITSGQMTATSKNTVSVNELFNQKLIEHGTANGVPPSELPDPSTVFSSLQQSKPGFRLKRNIEMRKSQGLPPTMNNQNYASSYHLTQKCAQRPPSGRFGFTKNINMSSTLIKGGSGVASGAQLPTDAQTTGRSPKNPRRRLISARYSVRASQQV